MRMIAKRPSSLSVTSMITVFSRRRLEKTVIIDVTDNELGRFAIIRIQDLLIELGHQVLLQRLGGGNGIEKELAFLFVLVGPGAVAARLRHVIAPFLIEFG